MYNGIINVYKEQGYTSHDVVAKLRGILHQKKIGHTGTLDPDAVGVLPVCLGFGTKLVEGLMDKTKEYTCILHLGITTDTEDITGKVLSRYEGGAIEDARIREVCQCFTGTLKQIPPMYSAIKKDGKRLYEIARAGGEVEREAREIVIRELEITGEFRYPLIPLRIVCSRGTYIRSLCRDIGEMLGCGGCMEQLVRTRSGSFTIVEALTLSQIAEYADGDVAQDLKGHLVPVEEYFTDCERLTLLPEAKRFLENGNKLRTENFIAIEEGRIKEEAQYRIYDDTGSFKAVYRYSGTEHCFSPVYMFL